MHGDTLPPLAAPPEWTGTPDEWAEMRARIIVGVAQTPDVRGASAADYAAARADLVRRTASDTHARGTAAQIARATARYTRKDTAR